MLALSRKKKEALIINNNIEVTILEIKNDQVKVGISAPKDVPIYRKEVYMQIITGQKDISYFDTYVKDYAKNGGDSIIRQINLWYQAHKPSGN